MPSHAIDMIIWDDTKSEEIIASAVSPRGLTFLHNMTNEDVSSVIVRCSPLQFIEGIPPGMEVAYNREDGRLVKIDGVQTLQ